MLGIIVGIVVGICCCAACVTAVTGDDNSTTNPTANNPGGKYELSEVNSENICLSHFVSESVPVLLTVVTSNAGRNTSDNNFQPPCYPQPTETNKPLMPRRQNSLPSYEDAIRMPSAPPNE